MPESKTSASGKAGPAAANTARTADGLVLIGAISGAHGIRGEVRLKSFAETPEDIAAYGPLTSGDGQATFEIVSLRPARDGFIARLKGVSDRNGAEALKGTGLHVARTALPQAEAGSWYHSDLVGLEVCDVDGARIGAVSAVFDFGAGDILEIALDHGRGTALIPFAEAFVPEVDVEAGRITIAPADGMIDGDEEAGEEETGAGRKGRAR